MGFERSYASRTFSRRTKVLTFNCARDGEGVARCQNCTTRLTTGRIQYNHIIPFEICRYSGPSNCEVLCTPCHALVTAERDLPAIADNNRMRAAHINARARPRHPFPCGRESRWSKPVGARAPVARQTQTEKLRAVLERRAILTRQAEA